MYIELFDIKGKSALVVGGAGGIGEKGCEMLSKAGVNLAIADINFIKAQSVSEKCKEKFGIESYAIKVDITNKVEVIEMVSSVEKTFGRIDILAFYVGYNNRQLIIDYPSDEWQKTLDINLTSVFHTTQSVAKVMKRNNGGKMVIISSIQGIIANPMYGPYAACKAGLIHYVKIIAQEWIKDGIFVNSIAPTATDTPFITDFLSKNPGKREYFENNIPIGRLAKPEDYMGPLLFLCSHASDFIIGQCLIVDGGESLH